MRLFLLACGQNFQRFVTFHSENFFPCCDFLSFSVLAVCRLQSAFNFAVQIFTKQISNKFHRYTCVIGRGPDIMWSLLFFVGV